MDFSFDLTVPHDEATAQTGDLLDRVLPWSKIGLWFVVAAAALVF